MIVRKKNQIMYFTKNPAPTEQPNYKRGSIRHVELQFKTKALDSVLFYEAKLPKSDGSGTTVDRYNTL